MALRRKRVKPMQPWGKIFIEPELEKRTFVVMTALDVK